MEPLHFQSIQEKQIKQMQDQLAESKKQIDSLRTEVQKQRVELETFLDIKRVTKRLGSLLINKSKKTLSNLKIKESLKTNHNESFKPYEVKPLHLTSSQLRKKILHVIGNLNTGGSARLVIDIIEHLFHNYEQEIVVREVPDPPEYLGLKYYHYEQLHDAETITTLLNAFKPDIVHVHYLGDHRDYWGEIDWKWYNQVFLALQKAKVPIIENINIPTDPYLSDAVRYYVHVSDYVKSKYGYKDATNVTIYPGSDFNLFKRDIGKPIVDDCIGMVYRLDGDKVNEDSINVFIEVIKRRSSTKALIVGGGSLLDVYRKKVSDAGLNERFTFTGYVSYEQLPDLYSQMSVFVAPVHRESFGQVTPFAMHMKLPVVAYRIGALPEIVNNEDLLAPPGDFIKLADIIINLLNDRPLRLKIGETNLKRSEDLFSVEAMVSSYNELYAELLLEQERL